MISLDSCLEGISSAAIAGHVRPDGDSVGSCLAVYNYLMEYYPDIEADVYLDPIPEKYRFLKNADRILDPHAADPSRKFDLFFALDCAEESRLGGADVFFQSAVRTVCVDHHITNESFADVNEVHPGASSTAELIERMTDPERITEEIAECLYLGIALDTGIFQYPCTSPLTMRIAGDLMAKGIPYSRIVDETFYVRTYTQQQIRGKALMDASLCFDGKCIYSVITKEDLARFSATPEDLDEIVSELRSTEGVEVSVFLYETGDGFKISLRSASCVDVAKIAKKFGGGGHVRAAGALASGDVGEILQAVLLQIKEQV